MLKEYKKPEIEFVSFSAQEIVTSNDYVDGSMGLEPDDEL